ncbi:MAG: virulence RhuM family protein [Alphaproteobacteria bacterium]|nr:virulence RhuM family protein [Alphaproteobacteria bacterium]MBP3516243.1 virulence RhuM family protein [Alphaproteobacteria bacterium]
MEKENLPKGEIVIYTSTDGKISLDTKLENETIWLTQDMMAKLFETTPQNITMHIKNIYDDEELEQNSTCKDFLQVRNEGKRTVSRRLTHYNLDMILSVGYRIKSKTAVQFRKWATNILKEYLIKGYAINQKAIKEQQEKLTSSQQIIELLNRSLENQIETVEQAQNVSKILHQYVTGLNLLDDFDHKRLDTQGITKRKAIQISVDEFLEVIDKMKGDFASDVFAHPKDESFNSSVNQIYQTFGGNELYPTLEEKAAMLLYLIVKNHSFLDGNKRIGASCFLYFMDKNGLLYDDLGCTIIDDATLFALTLLIAESKPEEMDTIKKVTVSILNRNKH